MLRPTVEDKGRPSDYLGEKVSRESRTVRPFNLNHHLASSLDAVTIMYDDQVIENGGHISVGEERQSGDNISVNWASNDSSLNKFISDLSDGCEESRIPQDALSLIVIASAKYLKRTEILFEVHLSKVKCLKMSSTFQLRQNSVLSAIHHEREISVVLVMNKNLEPAPLRPWRKGIWLARADFKIKVEKHIELFRPTPLDDDVRKDLNLPKECMRYVYFDDTDILSPLEQSSSPLFYIDKDILLKLELARSTELGKQMQLQIAIDFITSAVYLASKVLNEPDSGFLDDKELLDSLVGRIVRNVNRGFDGKPTTSELIGEVRDEPRIFLARVEHFLKIKRSYQNVLNRAL